MADKADKGQPNPQSQALFKGGWRVGWRSRPHDAARVLWANPVSPGQIPRAWFGSFEAAPASTLLLGEPRASGAGDTVPAASGSFASAWAELGELPSAQQRGRDMWTAVPCVASALSRDSCRVTREAHAALPQHHWAQPGLSWGGSGGWLPR